MAAKPPTQAGIYLVRHLKPLIPAGVCYGQSDVPAETITPAICTHLLSQLPPQAAIFSSPLERCRTLATHLFPNQSIQFNPLLMELNFGAWEMCPWDTIPREQLDLWAGDQQYFAPPNGESFADLCARVQRFMIEHLNSRQEAILITHAGVIKAFIHMLGAIALEEALGHSVAFGTVTKVVL